MLPDVIGPGLRAVFCGTAAGARSAELKAYYAGPGNSFWKTLHETGLTPRQLQPSEYRELPQYHLGLTDLCKVVSGSDREVGTAGFDVDKLRRTLAENAPDWIAFNGKRSASVALGRAVDYGEQPERIRATSVFVLPSTSGAARAFWDVRLWHEFAERVRI